MFHIYSFWGRTSEALFFSYINLEKARGVRKLMFWYVPEFVRWNHYPSLLASGPGSMSAAKGKGRGLLGGPVVKDRPCGAGDTGSVPGLGRCHVRGAAKPECHNHWAHGPWSPDSTAREATAERSLLAETREGQDGQNTKQVNESKPIFSTSSEAELS